MNKIISYKNLNEDLISLINEIYPNGFEEKIKSFTLGPDKKFHAFPLKTSECDYLVKVDVNIDMSIGLMAED
jgi:hypothetical protein